MHDYFGYPDATFDTPTKPCQYCNGKGWRTTNCKVYITIAPFNFEELRLPAFKKCITCDGSGVVDLNQE